MARFLLFFFALCGVSVLAQNATTQNATKTTSSTLTTGTSTSGNVTTLETSSPGVISPNYVLTGFEECTPDQITWIKDGFSDMITMLMADTFGNYPEVDWNSAAAQDFWGPYERNNGYRDDITDNLNRAAAVTYQWWINPFAKRLHARCDDPLLQCTCTAQGETDAYTISHQPNINFCPGYFKRPALATALATPEQGAWEYVLAFYSRATVWSHELMHVGQIGQAASPLDTGIIDQPVKGWPGIPYSPGSPSNTGSYGDWFTKWLAQSGGSIITDAVDNADNYALFYTSNYVQSKLDYYPSKRQVPISPTSINGVSTSNVSTTSFLGDTPFDYEHYCYSSSRY